MNNSLSFTSANTILYCKKWAATVAFYRQQLKLPITFNNDWFVEFQLTGPARLSVADETRASVKSSDGAGITVTLEVEDIEAAWQELQRRGIPLGPIQKHGWGARVFYFYDPEGHRLEIWSK